MNRKFFFLLFFFPVFNLSAQFSPVDTSVLNRTFKELQANPNSSSKQKAFFEAFPGTWNEFIKTYGYWGEKSDLAMYYAAKDHIAAFEKVLPNLPDDLASQKIIELSIGGIWEADAPNYLQTVVREYINQKPEVIFKALSVYSDGKQLRFWQYVFSTPLPYEESKKMLAYLREKISIRNYKNELRMMQAGYDFSDGECSFGGREFPG